MLRKMLIPVIGLLFLVPTVFAATYQIDPVHTQVHFTVPHLVVFKVRGNFDDFIGTIETNPTTKTLKSVTATIKVASINTRNQKRDKHLRSTDFFAVDQYQEMTFNSKKVTGAGADITVVGDLTIKGITREVTLKGAFLGAAVDPWGNQRAGFEATGKVNRKDFGLQWNKVMETGGMVVGDDIEIGLEVEAVMDK